MVARHFLSEGELTALLRHNPGINDHEARSLNLPVQGKNYKPLRREHSPMAERAELPDLPNPEDPDSCNVYKDLEFPPEVYEHIAGYDEEKVGQRGRGKMSHSMELSRRSSTGISSKGLSFPTVPN